MRPANGEAAYCAHCERDCPQGPDVCLGVLVGASEACCGHGWVTTPYAQFEDGERVEGRDAITYFADLGVGPPPVETVSAFMFDMYDRGIVVQAEYEYESLRLRSVSWFNATEHEPTLWLDDTETTLTNGHGLIPFTDLYCCVEDGHVMLPFGSVRQVA